MRSEQTIYSFVLLVLAGGCSQTEAFFFVPEHQELGLVSDDVAYLHAEFEIVNGLRVPVEIKEIYPSCACTEVQLSKNPIPARSSAKLSVSGKPPQRAGEQEFSVLLITDNSEFRTKRITFTAFVSATETHHRRLSLGSFLPGAEIDVAVPCTAISRGSVRPAAEDEHVSGMSLELATPSDGENVLRIRGTAPQHVGRFGASFELIERFGDALETEGTIELEVVGEVTALWNVPREVYAGFLSVEADRFIHVEVSRQLTLRGINEKRTISRILAVGTETWISFEDWVSSSEQVTLRFQIHPDKVDELGAVQASFEVVFEYGGTDAERYPTKVFAYLYR